METLHTNNKLCVRVRYFRGIFLTGLKNNKPLIIPKKNIIYFKTYIL